jgi:galactose mutarotase-like enzyme
VIEFQTIKDGEATLDEIASGDLRVRVSRTGAEMISMAHQADSGWVGFLYRDGEVAPPAAGWANHATVMGYFLHRLWHEQSDYRGKIVRGGNHGFLRHFAFDEPRRIEDGLVYSVPADRVPTDAYPLRVALELSYRLVDDALRIEFSFTNEEPELSAHVSFGLHPGFAVASLDDARLLLPAGRYRRYLAPGNFLNGQTELVEVAEPGLPFAKSALPGSFLLGLEDVPDRTIVLESPARGTRVSFDFAEVPFVTLWSDSDDFLCVEPCWGLPDSNPPVPFEEKIGIQVIPPGGVLRRSLGLRPEILG